MNAAVCQNGSSGSGRGDPQPDPLPRRAASGSGSSVGDHAACSATSHWSARSSSSARRPAGRHSSGGGTSGIGSSWSRPGSVLVEVERLGVDRPAVLLRDHPAGEEGAAVAEVVDVVDRRDARVAGLEEVGVQRVHGERRRRPCATPRPAPARRPARRRRSAGWSASARPGTGRRRSSRGRAASTSSSASRGISRRPRARTLGSVEPGEEPLELLAELLAGRQRLVARRAGWSRSPRRARRRRTAARARSTTSATSSLAAR